MSVDGTAELAGPDDALPGLAPDRLPGLLRDVVTAVGRWHPDWAEHDATMVAQRRVAVLVTPRRAYTNPG